MQKINEWDSKHFDKYLEDDEEKDRVYDIRKKLDTDIKAVIDDLYGHYKESLGDKYNKSDFIQSVMEVLYSLKK